MRPWTFLHHRRRRILRAKILLLPPPRRQSPLDAVIGDEEERGAGCGARKGGSDAGIYAAETTAAPEAGGGLQSCFQGVEGVQRCIYCRAGDGACLRDSVSWIMPNIGQGSEQSKTALLPQ